NITLYCLLLPAPVHEYRGETRGLRAHNIRAVAIADVQRFVRAQVMIGEGLGKDFSRRFGVARPGGDHDRIKKAGNPQPFKQTEEARVKVGNDPETQAAGLESCQRLNGLGIELPGFSAGEAGKERVEVGSKLRERS